LAAECVFPHPAKRLDPAERRNEPASAGGGLDLIPLRAHKKAQDAGEETG